MAGGEIAKRALFYDQHEVLPAIHVLDSLSAPQRVGLELIETRIPEARDRVSCIPCPGLPSTVAVGVC